MKRTFNVLGWAVLASLALSAVVVVVALAMSGSVPDALSGATLRIGGEPIDLEQLGAGGAVIAFGAVALALLIAMLVVPLAVLIPIAIVAVVLACVLGGVLLLVAGVFALLCSPLLFVALVIWIMVRLIRGSDAKPAPPQATLR